MEEDEDTREVELSTIAAIFPEELKIDGSDPFAFIIELPVSLSRPLVVKFPALSEPTSGVPAPGATAQAADEVDSQELSNLPSLQLHVSLPEGYPREKPPTVRISTAPPWLPEEVMTRLEGDASRLWEEIGRYQVVFTYIDNVQQSAEKVFGLVNEDNTLEVGPEHKIAILDYDIEAKRKAFERGSFNCGICLDPKKGSVCHRMIDCGHVFCVSCLQDFYNSAITEGDVASVRCLEPNCADKREKAARAATPSKKRKLKTYINPSELLQIPLDHEMVKRYVTIKHKSELESDKNTVYCPRPWCQGAARSKKHRKPEGLEFVEGSEEESDDEKTNVSENDRDLLAICEDCGFAFCSRCGLSWHGAFQYCMPKERKDAITEEEKASLEYIKMHTTPCPTCASPCQKTHGCNHMRCFRCQSHFCYLCSAWLNPANPYQHFNVQPSGQVNSCFMRLWELEGGDGNDVGIAYQGPDLRHDGFEAGQHGQPLEILQPQVEADSDSESEEADAEEGVEVVAQPQPLQEAVQAPQQAGGRFAVAREGPLVLRIEGNLPPVRGRAQEAGRQVQPVPPPRGGLRAAANNGQRRGRGRGIRGRGGAPRVNRQNDRMQGQNQRPIRRGRENGQIVDDHDPLRHALNQEEEEWVRQFVQFALNDQEHLLDEGDSGDEND